jgi:hypothetical protein
MANCPQEYDDLERDENLNSIRGGNFTDDGGGQSRRIKFSTQIFHIERQYLMRFDRKCRFSTPGIISVTMRFFYTSCLQQVAMVPQIIKFRVRLAQ